MNHIDNNNEKKGNGAITGITGAVLGLVAFATMKAITDKETREKIIDTFLEIKKKLSDSTRTVKRENSEKTELKRVIATDK